MSWLWDWLPILLLRCFAMLASMISFMHLMDASVHGGGTDSAIMSIAFGVMALLLLGLQDRMETKVWQVKVRNSDDER